VKSTFGGPAAVRRDRGFSLIEMLIAMAITLALMAGVFAMVHPAHGAFDPGLELADMQQRVRVATDALARELAMAGAGAYMAGRVGPLIRSFAPVRPFREGVDPAGSFRTDAITIIFVPSTAAQTTLAADLGPSETTLQALAQPGCPAGINLCGFAPGMTVVVYDDTGSVDAYTLVAVADAAAQLTLSAPHDSGHPIYRRGSNIVEARVHSYYLKADAASQTFQLRRGDSATNADVPVVDHVVGLTFTYDAEPQPPRLTATGDTSYGPPPPDPGTATTAYPAGENCAFRIDEASGLPVSRLPPLTAGATLTPLAASQLQDGPWCPDEASANRWDADLLRIRRVGVTIRVEAALAALRGPAGALFANAGSARTAPRWAPDQELRFQVSPRNMNLERE
jgi:prepilin-type N-terminal cleavage/methylation domain-containing protein